LRHSHRCRSPTPGPPCGHSDRCLGKCTAAGAGNCGLCSPGRTMVSSRH
jgi:hypothetical protein